MENLTTAFPAATLNTACNNVTNTEDKAENKVPQKIDSVELTKAFNKIAMSITIIACVSLTLSVASQIQKDGSLHKEEENKPKSNAILRKE